MGKGSVKHFFPGCFLKKIAEKYLIGAGRVEIDLASSGHFQVATTARDVSGSNHLSTLHGWQGAQVHEPTAAVPGTLSGRSIGSGTAKT